MFVEDIHHHKRKCVVLWNFSNLKCMSIDWGMSLIQTMQQILRSRTFRFCVGDRQTHGTSGTDGAQTVVGALLILFAPEVQFVTESIKHGFLKSK